jgi:hypothetical protein
MMASVRNCEETIASMTLGTMSLAAFRAFPA